MTRTRVVFFVIDLGLWICLLTAIGSLSYPRALAVGLCVGLLRMTAGVK